MSPFRSSVFALLIVIGTNGKRDGKNSFKSVLVNTNTMCDSFQTISPAQCVLTAVQLIRWTNERARWNKSLCLSFCGRGVGRESEKYFFDGRKLLYGISDWLYTRSWQVFFNGSVNEDQIWGSNREFPPCLHPWRVFWFALWDIDRCDRYLIIHSISIFAHNMLHKASEVHTS